METNKFYLLILFIVTFLHAKDHVIRKIGEPIVLSPMNKYFILPKWSPDGEYISVTEPTYNGIYVISVRDKSIYQITVELGAGYKYQWSPDGRFIAARVNEKRFDKIFSSIKIFEIPSGKSRIIKEYRQSDQGFPLWTKDGKSIYLNFSNKLEIFHVFNEPKAYQHDNLIYVKDNQVYIYNLQKETEINILSLFKIDFSKIRIIDISISPDHNKIAIETDKLPIYVISINDSIMYELPEGNGLSWSPDSKYIAFCKSTDDGHKYISSDIYISSWDGKNVYQLTKTTDKIELSPSWSPNGNWITYSLFNSGKILIQNIKILKD